MPDYDIIEWNETNFDVNSIYYTKKAAAEKKWAFASDYARLKILNEFGGLYFDTDVEVMKNFDALLRNNIFLGYEADNIINGAVIGSKKNNSFLKKCILKYQGLRKFDTLPNIITEVYKLQDSEERKAVKIYEREYFYPFYYNEMYDPGKITDKTYSIHWWAYSWQSNREKFLNIIKKNPIMKFVITQIKKLKFI